MAHILVVDDNPVDRKLISAILQRTTNWTVDTVNDGQQAVDFLQRAAADLVVTDLQMPNMDGVTLVQKIRRDFRSIPVVLVTAFGSEQESVAALQAGAANFSHKTRLKTDLVPTVRNVLDWAQAIRQRSSDDSRTDLALGKQQMAFVLDNCLGQIRTLIETLDANLPEWAAADSLRISMALEEALCNAICHGNLEVDSRLKERDGNVYEDTVSQRLDCEPFCERRVRVQVEFSVCKLKFEIDDDGQGFNPGELPDPTSPENIRKPSGRGLLLIRSFMDEVLHNASGNHITLIKNRREV